MGVLGPEAPFSRVRGNGGFSAPKPSFPGIEDSDPCRGSADSQRRTVTNHFRWKVPIDNPYEARVSELQTHPALHSLVWAGRMTQIRNTQILVGSKTAPFRGCASWGGFFLKTVVWQLYCALVLRGCNCSAVLLLGSSHTTSLTLRLTRSPDHKNGNWHFPSDSKQTGGPP